MMINHLITTPLNDYASILLNEIFSIAVTDTSSIYIFNIFFNSSIYTFIIE